MTRATLLAASLCSLVVASDAAAAVRFINLSNRDVVVARYGYSPPQSRSGDLTVYSEGGWTYSGWYRVKSGESWETSDGNFYVKDGNGPITWPNRKSSTGYITSKKFNAFLPEGGGFRAKERELLQKGYRAVNFQALSNGNFNIGSDYRLLSRKYDFDYSSRDVKFHNGDWSVPGRVAYYTVSARDWGARGKNWGMRDNKVWVSLSTEGAQKRAFGPREKGYYTGSVTIYYTQKK